MIKNREYLITTISFAIYWIIVYSVFRYSFQRFFHIWIPQLSVMRCIIIATVITIFTILLYLLIFKSNIDKTKIVKALYCEKAFLFYLIIAGLIVSIIIPITETPDEYHHLSMIYSDMGVKAADSSFNYFDTISNNASQYYSIDATGHKIVDVQKYINMDNKLSFPQIDKLPSLLMLRHLPQTIGILITSLLNLPVFICITISEFLAVLTYSLICYWSLKITPIKKPLFAITMALPICIQQMGSFSYDALQIPLCFLFVSLILNYKFKLKKIKWKHICALIAILLYIAIIKLPYVILGLLIILLPKGKFSLSVNFNNKITKVSIIIILSLLLVLISFIVYYLVKTNVFAKIVAASFFNISGTLELFDKTVYSDIFRYLTEISGTFGWLDTPSPRIFSKFVLVVYILIALFSPMKEYKLCKFKLWEKISLLVLLIFSVTLIILSMIPWQLEAYQHIDYSNYTVEDFARSITEFDNINGVQGRYLVVLIPLLFIPFSAINYSKFISKKINYKFSSELYYLAILIYMVLRLIGRYWI